jgi:putative transposase
MPNSPDDQLPRRKTEHLHAGRVSAQGAVYFVTFVTEARRPWLAQESAGNAILGALRAWHAEGDGGVLAATVMPDHVHVIFEVGERLSVGRCVSRWKSQGRKASGYPGEWQRDFYEHQLRTEESLEDYGLYLVLNPYRAGVCEPEAAWPGWWCARPKWFRFTTALSEHGVPPTEWIGWDADRFSALMTGE